MQPEIRIHENRLGSYALICAIEYDLRGVITEEILPKVHGAEFLGNLEEKCRKRALSNPADGDTSISNLINYLDFQDASAVLLSNTTLVDSAIIKELKRLMTNIETISGIRNRVMHSRPMEHDDYFILSNFCSDIPTTNGIRWTTTKRTLQEIQSNPNYLLQVVIPQNRENDLIIHNLPDPDFDDTGFIGRKAEIADIKSRLRGNNKVVTLIGNGGVGKSALALKVAYDFLDDTTPEFDVIVWVEAKKNILTESGIKVIRDNISPINLIKDIHAEYSSEENQSNLIEATLESLAKFNTLLVIDNLETILSQEILRFIREASSTSTILITSRIGLGELEYRMELDGLKQNEALQLFRQYGKIKGVKDLAEADNRVASKLIDDLHRNPLAIRWFINSVAVGKSPVSLRTNQVELLNYCLGNVYEHLSGIEKEILEISLAYRSESISEAEMLFILGKPHILARSAIARLLATTFLKRTYSKTQYGMECLYSIPEFAKNYLTVNRVLKPERYSEIQRILRQLSGSTSAIEQTSEHDYYNIQAISAVSSSEKVAARILMEVLSLSKKGHDLQELALKIDAAIELAQGYTENYRVSAFIKAERGDYPGAESDYLTGLEIDPHSKKLLYFYVGFLLIHVKDCEKAREYSHRLLKIDPNNLDVKIIHSRCLCYTGELEDAIEIIKPIAENERIRNAKHRRVSASLYIDYLRRQAEFEAQTLHDCRKAFDTLKRAIDYYWTVVGRKDSDAKMREKVDNVFSDMRFVSGKLKDSRLTMIFGAEYDRFCSNGVNASLSHFDFPKEPIVPTRRVQEGKIDTLNNNYGFIRSDDGQRYFFHQNWIEDDKGGEGVRIGARVTFEFGENHQGVTATNICCV